MTLKGSNDETLYQASKKQFGMVTLTPIATGTYTACFSNEFSVVSGKRVYMSFQVGEKPPQPHDEKDAATHGVESSLVKLRDTLDAIVDQQTLHRLREVQGRKVAELLNAHVLF
ncbi:hypothetical protein HPB48_013915 [Haemaphysalis longicornis]|uniref:GOLD domain-containing protein n=1 Tax=Haemaphysalis longicornis TaxID=44386 RepID=A0A9J6FUR2_HAELO|nr:hypothetical protein HPB48_013915 [Haemaphysalis longicornis]